MQQNKVQNFHIEKLAYIYLRQSTMGQVRFNQESTERQYALQGRAQQMGWDLPKIKVLDGDLGMSGAQAYNREDFNTLVTDVSLGKVGAIFVLEASRLSRSCSDWHKLLEVCAFNATLIIDEDGCYNPLDFNDQLLLGLKGTMSQAELHFIRARLLGGKLNKAKKGDLRFPLPVGFCHDDQGAIKFDDDQQVLSLIQLIFKIFKEKGSAYGVVQYFCQQKIQFPKRAYGGIWKGTLVWGALTHSRVCSILKNPSYAGAYVYGRFKGQKKLSSTGHLQATTICLPMHAWNTLIKDHHPAYITWEEYIQNVQTLTSNRTNQEENMLPTAVREGLGLLQGLLICSCCGHRLSVRYKGNNGIYLTYECNWKKREGEASTGCVSVRGDFIDKALEEKVLIALQPAQIGIAIKAFEELETRTQMLDKQWQMKIERADYQAQLAQRRYQEVDPSNRLVAATLEKRWNEALAILEETQLQYEEYTNKNILKTTEQQKAQVLALAKDLPRLWHAPSTNVKDRKHILRLLVKDITVEKLSQEQKVVLHIRWQTNATEDLELPLPQKSSDKWRHPQAIIEQVRQLATTMTDIQIANTLNEQGLITNKGRKFTVDSIQWIRHKHKIPMPSLQKPEELSVNQVAKKFNVNHYIVRYWIQHKLITARRIGSRLWISLDLAQELELKRIAESSTKIAAARLRTQKQIEGGVL
jgi:DNA invertase Pin-like site-specific DNA recombinase